MTKISRACSVVFAAIAALAASASLPTTSAKASLIESDGLSLSRAEGELFLQLDKVLKAGAPPDTVFKNIAAIEIGKSRTARERLIIGMARAQVLADTNRTADAVQLMETVAASAPEEPMAHAVLAQLAFEAQDNARAAREIIAAVHGDSTWSNRFDDYDLALIFDGLKEAGYSDLYLQLARRLFDESWTDGYAFSRSAIARQLVRYLLERNDVRNAQRYLFSIEAPDDLAALLSQHRFKPLQPAIRDWAGAKLEKQWPAFIDSLRRRFRTAGDPTSANDYIRGLRLANQDKVVVAEMQDFVMAKWQATKDEAWVAPLVSISWSIAHEYGLERGKAFLTAAEKVIDADSPNQINFPTNRAYMTLLSGDFTNAARQFENVVAQAQLNEAVTKSVMGRLLAYRMCARFKNGHDDALQDAEALSRNWSNQSPGEMAWMWTCFGEPGRARQSWLAGLKDAEARFDLLDFLQPDEGNDLDTQFAKELDQRFDALRQDQELRKAAAEVGTILPWRLADNAPQQNAVSNIAE